MAKINHIRFDYPFIQVAGIKSYQEAQMLIDCGIKYLGFPMVLDYHNPDLDKYEAKEVISRIGKKANPVLITYQQEAMDVLDLASYLDIKIIQFHGNISPVEISKVKATGNFTVIKSLIINNNIDEIIANIDEYESCADFFITDTYDPLTGASGATGKTHDWGISRVAVDHSSKPVILAGGLNPENVYDAVKFVKPFGVDSHTGLEDKSGDKSSELVMDFTRNALKAFREISRFYR